MATDIFGDASLRERIQQKVQWASYKVLPVLRFATEAWEKIPTADDTWPQRITKVLALTDSALKVAGGEVTGIWEKVRVGNYVPKDSEIFIQLLFRTSMKEDFTFRRKTIDEYVDLLEATSSTGQTILFCEKHYRSGETFVDSTFFVKQDMNLDTVINRLWERFPNGIYISLVRTPGSWKTEIEICHAPEVEEKYLSLRAKSQLDRMVQSYRSYQEGGVHRTYLCYGPPGSGKSTFATLFSKRLGGKGLRVDATGLESMSIKDFEFILDTLKPNVLIIDDVDRADIKGVAARILFLMEHLKSHYPTTAVVLTVNDPKKLDHALLREGRIDIPVRFEAPGEEESRQMVGDLLIRYGLKPELVDRVIEAMKGQEKVMTHAYLAGLCMRLKHESLEEVLANVKLLASLAQDSDEAKKETPPK